MIRIVDVPTLRAERRALASRELVAQATLFDQPLEVPVRIAHGEMETYELDRPLRHYLSALLNGGEYRGPSVAGEMLTTPANLSQFIIKTVVDLQLGREQVPLLYPAIYTRTINDANLTENVDVGAIMARASVVFLQHMEGGEVRFGTRTLTPRQTVPLATYAAGFEYTEDMVEYDKTWEVAQLNEGIGRGYNALLNHIHIYPIISYAYQAKNQTPADATAGTSFREKMRATLKAALIHSGQDLQTDTGLGRSPNVLLAHSSRRWDIEEALQRFVINGTEYPALAGIDTLVFYDGYSITVGARKYTYTGCATNKAYLIDTSTYLVELVKHDLRTDAAPGDLSRLIQQQIVARARRGVFCSPPNAVEEVTLP
jgi:hypothetical protein